MKRRIILLNNDYINCYDDILSAKNKINSKMSRMIYMIKFIDRKITIEIIVRNEYCPSM